MNYLTISYFRGEKKFSPSESPIIIGRSDECHIQILDSCVSRKHLQVTWRGTDWEVTDISSTGVYNTIGRQESHWTLASPTMLALAHTEGPEITFYPLQTGSAEETNGNGFEPGETSEKSLGLMEDLESAQVAEELSSISFVPSQAPQQTRTPTKLRSPEKKNLLLCVETATQIYEFVEETRITVGRDPLATVRIEEVHGIVSRTHLSISKQQDRWTLEDTSSRGTFAKRKRIDQPHTLSSSEEIFRLGDPVEGLPIKVFIKEDL